MIIKVLIFLIFFNKVLEGIEYVYKAINDDNATINNNKGINK